MKKGKTIHNFISNKKVKIKESDKEINKTVENNNTNNSNLNLIMRNDDFNIIKNNSLNTYNNYLELKEHNNKSVSKKRNVNNSNQLLIKKIL